MPASEYYKIYQQTKQLNKQRSSFSDNELSKPSLTTRKQNDSDISTDSEYSNNTEGNYSKNLRTSSSSLVELGNIEKMDGISNLHPDIKVKGGIADRYGVNC